MAHAANADRRIVMGIERYKRLREPLTPAHFDPARLLYPVPEETNGAFPEIYEMLRKRWSAGPIRYVGDKNPFYTKRLAEITAAFPDVRFAVMFRDLIDVANSWQYRANSPRDHWPLRNGHERALMEWNLALADARAYVEAGGQLFLVDYIGFLSGDESHVTAFYGFLKMRPSPQVIRHLREGWSRLDARERVLTPEAIAKLEGGRDRDLEAWARQRIKDQLHGGV